MHADAKRGCRGCPEGTQPLSEVTFHSTIHFDAFGSGIALTLLCVFDGTGRLLVPTPARRGRLLLLGLDVLLGGINLDGREGFRGPSAGARLKRFELGKPNELAVDCLLRAVRYPLSPENADRGDRGREVELVLELLPYES